MNKVRDAMIKLQETKSAVAVVKPQ